MRARWADLGSALAPVAAGMGVMAAAAAVLVPVLSSGPAVPHDPPLPAPPRATSAAPAAAGCTEENAAESLRPSGADGDAVKRIKKAGVLVVGVDQNSYRWGYRDPDNPKNLIGFDIDLAKAIARDILGPDPDIVYRAIPTNQRIDAVKQRKVDMVVRTMTINCERKKDVAFSTAYFEAGQQVLAPKRSSIDAFDDSLRGKKICTAKGSTGEQELDGEDHGATVMTVPNQLDCLVRLQLGEADAVVTDSALAAGQAAQDPAVELKGEPFSTDLYGVAMNKEDEDLVRRVNKVLEDYRAGGADSPWTTAYDKWLKADLPGVSGPPAPQYSD
ncbi:glutamate ABC transporter substrate-binding protein [Streptomyces purpurogeneiscleroticus]|uniref:glutamate ABC transporter substrate-binding protein n=1 Tax=Streptomyces purpurogeneiscleroticus TaxID=68259 RepID=UPI001CBF37D8|nr:glutamate ABC transporter substrate-binding protein [Streptomyces purpurogeneiscleroticus]MBZ4016536.1 sugar-binding protein [Streptomyces purpurogeneiscleroticus]